MHPTPRLLLWFLLLSFPGPALALTNIWFSPEGRGDGSSREQSRAWDSDQSFYRYLGLKAVDPDVVYHFLPGVYVIQPINTATTEPSAFRLTLLGHGARPEDTVLKLAAPQPLGVSDHGYSWVSLVDLARNAEHLRRFVAENLTFDGGWDLQTLHNHPGYLRSFRVSPVRVSARTGRIRNVLVRNFGAHGLMPRRPGDSIAGVEVFPLTVNTVDEGQAPEDGDPTPWLIEDCEVAGMESVYAGYATLVMVNNRANVTNVTPEWARNDPLRRVVTVRRVQARGSGQHREVLGFGSAGHGSVSGKITFSDNVVLNAVSAFNTDTGTLQDLDFTNSLFLDVTWGGNFGQADSGPNHARYTYQGNSVRLFGAFTWPIYDDFGLTNHPGTRQRRVMNDQEVSLGRRQHMPASGLRLMGAARDIRVQDNWFTARPRDTVQLDGSEVWQPPGYRLIFKLANNFHYGDTEPARFRGEALNVTVTGNQVAGTPFDFSRLSPVDSARYDKFSETTRADILKEREPRASSGVFRPVGTVDRVHLLLTNVPRRYGWTAAVTNDAQVTLARRETNLTDQVLFGAEELVILRPVRRSDAPERLIVRVRLALQPTPFSGLRGTVPLAGRRVFLEVLPGSRHPQTLAAVTDSRGLATFACEAPRNAHGMDFFRAWLDAGKGTEGRWDEHQDAWSTASHAHGTTVSVTAEPDIADARHGRPAVLRFNRTGSARSRLAVPIKVSVVQPDGSHSEASEADLKAFQPARSAVESKSSTEAGVVFEPGQSTAMLGVRAPHDTGAKVFRVEVLEGEGYAPGERPAAHVVFYRPALKQAR